MVFLGILERRRFLFRRRRFLLKRFPTAALPNFSFSAVAAEEIEVGFVNHYYIHRFLSTEGEGFSAKLWSIDLTGYNERQIQTPTDASDPSWSSLLSN